jgi:hypothetical protein
MLASIAAESDFYEIFVKIDDAFFLVLMLFGFVAVLLRVRKNGLLATLAAILGIACLSLPMLYWTLQAFDVITGSDQYVWAAAQIVFDLGVALLIAALVLPKVGAIGSAKTPPAPVPAQWPGQPVPGQPPAYGSYAPPAAQTSPPPAWPQNPPQSPAQNPPQQ